MHVVAAKWDGQNAVLVGLENTPDYQVVYWSGGPSYCHVYPRQNLQILAEYGDDDAPDFDWEAVELQFAKTFPLPPSTLAQLAISGDGFIAPSGAVYVCGFMGHSSMANSLAQELGHTPTYAVNGEDYLESQGWVAIRVSVVNSKQPPTQAQRFALEALEAETKNEFLQQAINRFFRFWSDD